MNTVYITSERKDELLGERKELTEKIIPDIADRINRAKELGDLSENFEYHEAKERMAFAHSRLQDIDRILNNAQIYRAPKKADVVLLGTKITVEKDHVSKEYCVVGGQEADPMSGKISHESPLGAAFLGKRVGEIAEVNTPKGVVHYKITKIE